MVRYEPITPGKPRYLVYGKWLTIVSGFSPSTSFPYTLYRTFIYMALFYFSSMQVATWVRRFDKDLIMEALPYFLIYVGGNWALTARLLCYRSYWRAGQILKTGVYSYENEEEEDQDLDEVNALYLKDVNFVTRLLGFFTVMGPVVNVSLYPLVQSILQDAKAGKNSDIVNPYLPFLFYQPFDTREGSGFVLGLFLGLVFFGMGYLTYIGANWTYAYFTIRMKTQFRILMESLKNIEKRAATIYRKNFGRKPDLARNRNELLSQDLFQECLFLCLRSNVRHHQAMLRLQKVSEPFYSSYLLDLFTLASMVLGVQLYHMNQSPPLSTMISLVICFISEHLTILIICILGQHVTDESKKVFLSLYGMSWMDYGKKFNQTLSIILTNTMKPMEMKAMLFGVPASLEIYGEIVSAMYKITNLARGFDVV